MLNHIDVMGRLTKDPEVRYTQSQKPVASFTIACDRDFGSGENGGKQTDFIDVTAWNATAEFVSKYFQKGSMAVVSGRLQSRQWEDRNGQKRTSWEINAENVYFGSTKNDRSTQQREETQATAPAPSGFKELQDEDDGDLPF